MQSTSTTTESELNSTRPTEEQTILFFDGVCGLCNLFVDFVLKHDKQQHLFLSPLQGETAARLLSEHDCTQLDSVVFWEHNQGVRYSTAVVRILLNLGWGWRILGCLLWLIPFPIRNLGYRIIAKSRYRIFGKKETCRMPTPEERERFLP